MLFLWLKVLHIISVVAWMATMLMYPRLKIYQLNDQPGGKLFEEMRSAGLRLRKIIMTPAIVGTWIFGLGMVAVNPGIISAGGSIWFPIKFLLVLGLSALHGMFVSMGKKIDSGVSSMDARRLRVINEIPFVILIAIVILVILKPF